MFINNRLNFQVRNDIIFNLNNIDLIAVEISKEELNTKRNVIILTLYRPPDVPPILFNEKLNDLLKMLQQENKTIFITGDFNLHNFTGYSHVYKLRDKRRGGGVSMFINSRLNFQVRNDIIFNLI